MSQKVEDTLNRISTHKGVKGVIIVDTKGIQVKSTMNPHDTIEYGSLINQFTMKAKLNVKSLHPDEEI